MTKATLTKLAWLQSCILWGMLYVFVFSLTYLILGWHALVPALIVLLITQLIRAYAKLARLLTILESRIQRAEPHGQGVWAALELLFHKKNQAQRKRITRLVKMLRGYRLAANAMPEGLLLVNRRSAYIAWSNKIAKRMLALSPRSDEIILYDLFESDAVKIWFKTQDSEQPLLNIVSPEKNEMYLDFFLLPYTVQYSLLILRDSTQMRKLEMMRSDFVANVSHELRTPLTVIHGYLELIEQQENPQLQSIIFEMQKQSTRMNHLVEDLLNLSRLESEKTLPEDRIQCPSLLHTLEQEAVALSQNRHRILLENTFHGCLLGSHKDIHSAFSNLISNAIRYTQTNGEIRIGMQINSAQGLDFWVSDTGFGIPKEHIKRLTERFYRVSSSRSRELGGTGLGLSICKHVLNLHQAELIIESEAGKGSTFLCRFPKQRIA